jgi:hypothetical protein
VTPTPPPPVGTIIYLASYLLKLKLSAEQTPPDTPNLFSGEIEVQGDVGDMATDALMGPQGFPGATQFPLRRQNIPVVNSSADLPTDLTDTQTDNGKYWGIDQLDSDGVVTGRQDWVWYGDHWRVIQMGTTGPPGAAPQITPSVDLISPVHPPYPDKASFINTSGGRLQQSWEFNLAVPQGPMGKATPLYLFADTDFSTIATNDILAASGYYTEAGEMIWKPLAASAFATQFYSMPESSFSAYSGISQQAAIGSFAIPAQPFPWTPIVWGHIGGGGVNLSKAPFKIGAEVLLGDPAHGTMIARGFGTTIGEMNIMPHYSTPADHNKVLTPTNQYAVVPANHTNPAQGTVYVNLWNDGQYGAYDFTPGGAQIFVLVLPLERGEPFQPF